ncbi:MAG: ribosome hibernation-promoting factor, HPF/YfiA family [Nitrospinota bacterium]
MQVTITGHNIEVTPALREYTEGKVSKVGKFLHNIIATHVILKVEKQDQIVEITIHVRGSDLHSASRASDMYAAIDATIDKLERQAKKVKGKNEAKRKNSSPK